MILLDTNAILWLDAGHRRIRHLAGGHQRLYISPASILELQVLREAGRLRRRLTTMDFLQDERWMLDEPPPGSWFLQASDIGWTRDPFDRLLAAHAQLRRWRIATADRVLLEQLGPAATVEL